MFSFSLQIDQASALLNEYNDRLQQELKDRKKVNKMISDFMAAQKDLESQAEERLEQYRDKLDKVNAVRDDLKSHIQSLPDLSKLPDVTGGLAPLPSAGDLFTVKWGRKWHSLNFTFLFLEKDDEQGHLNIDLSLKYSWTKHKNDMIFTP